jgi:hypothetical protein
VAPSNVAWDCAGQRETAAISSELPLSGGELVASSVGVVVVGKNRGPVLAAIHDMVAGGIRPLRSARPTWHCSLLQQGALPTGTSLLATPCKSRDLRELSPKSPKSKITENCPQNHMQNAAKDRSARLAACQRALAGAPPTAQGPLLAAGYADAVTNRILRLCDVGSAAWIMIPPRPKGGAPCQRALAGARGR